MRGWSPTSGGSAITAGTHGSFEDIVASAKPALRPVCISLRRTIAALHEEVVEVAWRRQRIASFGIGPRKMSDHYAYIAVHASHVNLGFYHGANLKDRAGLLEGTGKRLRHVKIQDVAAARGPAIVAILRQAIADLSAMPAYPMNRSVARVTARASPGSAIGRRVRALGWTAMLTTKQQDVAAPLRRVAQPREPGKVMEPPKTASFARTLEWLGETGIEVAKGAA